ncbi:MAG: RNA polymerase sigma factor RpoD/SigA [Treponema sp.]|jgi:RNA polymerase primary sigma factor|nr:RNA polymerase sigma factor RpoD/SigA [Treponema sp.]
MTKKSENNYQDDGLGIYFNQASAFPLLTFEEELELSRRCQQGDIEARHKLVNCNLRLVVKIARCYTGQDVSFMDLIQEGNLGLIHAAEKYRHEKNVRFCTYAVWWIRQSIHRYITNKRRLVRLPHRKEEVLRRIRRTYHSLSQTLMHQPRNEDIAREMGIPVQDIDSLLNMSSAPLTLGINSLDNDYEKAVEDYEDYTYSPERNLIRESSKAGARRVLNTLKDRERRVLTYRYQLDGDERHTLSEIGNEMDLSAETIRQIEIRAMKKIRSHAKELKDCIVLEAI